MPKVKQNRSAKWQFLQKPGPDEGFVIGQVRYSSDNQDPRTIEAQKAHIIAAVEKEGWTLVGWCEEPESSASYDELDYRPEFARLLTEDAGRKCNIIVCDESSRWARSAEVGFKSLRLLRERKCWWQTVQDDWNINKPLTDGGAIMWAITQSQNEEYSRKISYHVHKGKTQKAKDGYSNGAPVYGYAVPVVEFDSTLPAIVYEERRRHLVYEPDPVYFPGLQ